MPVDRHDGPWLKGVKHPLRIVVLAIAQIVTLPQPRIRLGLGGKGVEKLVAYFILSIILSSEGYILMHHFRFLQKHY